MHILYLLLKPDYVWELLFIILICLGILICLPAVFIHRCSLLKKLTQYKFVILPLLMLLLMVGFMAKFDLNQIKAYYFAKQYGWNVIDIGVAQEILFQEKESENISEGSNTLVYHINDPRDLSPLICSEIANLPSEQIINKKITVYPLKVKENIDFTYQGIVFQSDIVVNIGFYNHKIVYAVLFIHNNPLGFGYYPITYHRDAIKEEMIKVYNNRPSYIPIYGNVRISHLPALS